MKKPCRLEINTAGSWKLLTKFDAAQADHTDDILLEAGHLVDAINAASGDTKGKGVTLRVSTDESLSDVLMRYETGRGWLASPGTTALLMEARKGFAGARVCPPCVGDCMKRGQRCPEGSFPDWKPAAGGGRA